MRKFISSVTAFYILSPGDKLSDNKLDNDINRMYLIYKKDEHWLFRHKWYRGWEITTTDVYQTEDEAFNASYESFLNIFKTKAGLPPSNFRGLIYIMLP